MTDNSFTGVFDNEVHYPLKKMRYEGNSFHFIDLSNSGGIITGNKSWKLKHNVLAWKASEAQSLLTFGGAYSNHIYQTAKLGHHLDIPTIGLIRGEIDDEANQTLGDARDWGMQLFSVDRSTYRNRNDPSYLEGLKLEHNCFILPEGGTNAVAVKGTTQLGQMIDQICDENGIRNIAIPVATGGTMAGIINGTNHKSILGYGVLKGDFLTKDVAKWIGPSTSEWRIEEDQLFGGYGKWNEDLIHFIQSFYEQTGVILDPIYTGKMMYAAHKSKRLNLDWVYIHTGGIQGNRGFNQRFKLGLPTS